MFKENMPPKVPQEGYPHSSPHGQNSNWPRARKETQVHVAKLSTNWSRHVRELIPERVMGKGVNSVVVLRGESEGVHWLTKEERGHPTSLCISLQEQL